LFALFDSCSSDEKPVQWATAHLLFALAARRQLDHQERKQQRLGVQKAERPCQAMCIPGLPGFDLARLSACRQQPAPLPPLQFSGSASADFFPMRGMSGRSHQTGLVGGQLLVGCGAIMRSKPAQILVLLNMRFFCVVVLTQ
jgi:hypothetical protein